MYGNGKLGFWSPQYFKTGNSTPNNSAKGFRRKSSLIKLGSRQKSQEYHQEYNNRNAKNSVYYDSNNPLSKDESFQQLIPTNQSQDSSNSLSNRKSLQSSQFSMSGFHSQRKRYQHQIMVLKKEIQKMKKQIQFKDKQISEVEQSKTQFREVEMELVETYRVINYYEGKMKEQEKIVEYLENLLDENVGGKAKGKLKEGLQFKEVIEFFRNQSIQLRGELEKTNHENTKLTMKLQKINKKYQQLEKTYTQAQRKTKKYLTSYQTTNLQGFPNQKQKMTTIYETRLQSSNNKLAMRRADDEVSMSGSVRSHSSQKSFRPQSGMSQNLLSQEKNEVSKMYGNFNSKINKIEKELDFFRIQNQKLLTELNQKIIENGKLLMENDQLKYAMETNQVKKNKQNNQIKRDPMIGVTFGKQSREKQSSPDLSQFVSNMPLNFSPIPKRQLSTKQLPKQKVQNSSRNDSAKKQPPKSTKQQNRKNQLKNMSLNEISKKLQENHSKSYKFKQISPETVRKIRYNLIREDITYVKLIDTIADKLVTSQNPNQVLQLLEDMPYQLTSKESSSFVFEFKKISAYLKEKQMSSSMRNTNQPIKDLSKQEQTKIMKQQVQDILKQNILPFKNITIRRDASLTSQLTKTFKNRLAELEPYLRDKKKTISFEEVENKFREEWNLGDEEIDFIFLKSCEETAQYGKFDFYKTINFFLEN